MLFSDPYIKVGQVMAVKEDNNTMVNKEDFKGKVIGAQTGTTGAIMAFDWEMEGVSKYKGYDSVNLLSWTSKMVRLMAFSLTVC